MISKAGRPFRIFQVVGQEDARVQLEPPDLLVEEEENRGVNDVRKVPRSSTELLGSQQPTAWICTKAVARSATKLEKASFF